MRIKEKKCVRNSKKKKNIENVVSSNTREIKLLIKCVMQYIFNIRSRVFAKTICTYNVMITRSNVHYIALRNYNSKYARKHNIFGGSRHTYIEKKIKTIKREMNRTIRKEKKMKKQKKDKK